MLSVYLSYEELLANVLLCDCKSTIPICHLESISNILQDVLLQDLDTSATFYSVLECAVCDFEKIGLF